MNPLPSGTVLCFDFGLARTGAAVGNTLTRSAEPLGIIRASSNAERWAAVERLVREWEPAFFVVGVPRHPDGAAGELTARCERFARQLAGRYGRPAFTADERYSSAVVEDGSGEKIDDLSAAVILQQFFDEGAAAAASEIPSE